MGNDLASLVHISDLHFGDAQARGAISFFQGLGMIARFRWFAGLLGHHERPLAYLERFFRRHRRRHSSTLLVTGDLTAFGQPRQFDEADEFLGVVPNLVYRQPTDPCLHDGHWRQRTISGNHDRFAGRAFSLVGGPTAGFNKFFPNPGVPWIWNYPNPLVTSTGTQVTLKFVGIDTDADVRPVGKTRLLARGDFASQLRNARNLLGLPGSNEIRVLLLHHSYRFSTLQTGRLLRIVPKSLQELEDFIPRYGIKVLLSGHIHAHHVERFSLLHSMTKQPHECLEARSGTTAQRTLATIRQPWRSVLKKAKALEENNTLLVHTLEEDHGTIYWQAETYVERRSAQGGTRSGFRPAQPADFTPAASYLRDRIAVWP